MATSRDYRVLLVLFSHTFGGAEVRVLTQARALQGRVAACKVAVIAGSPLHERLLLEGLPCETLPDRRGDPLMAWRLRGIIRRGGYTVVDSHNVQSILWGGLGALLGGAKGRVATVHSDYGAEYPGLKGRIYEGILWFNRFITRQYINVTEVLQIKAIKRGMTERATLIHNAVPVPEALPGQKNAALLGEWDLTPQDFVLAIVARLKPVKGHKYLLEAMALLRDLPRLKLLIVGDGPLRPELDAQVETLGIGPQVRFAGFRQDIPEILKTVDATCMASLSEALPYAVLEAASYARPMVVTAVGGLATLLTDHETALLVPPKDPAALAGAIRWLVEKPAGAERLGLAAYELVERAFSVDSMIEQVLQVYDKALT